MAPVDKTSPDKMSGFKLISSCKSHDTFLIHKYKSINTGITVFIADIDGPLIHGNFCLATETFDDDGLPHILEHLIFLGSEEYPYKGVLDLLAIQCLGSGTNACTQVHRTTYSLKAAGSKGFLFLMPIFLDHILYPTLKNSAYITEVHHITGEGEDAGIVYSEMQARVNDGEELVDTELRRAAYPGKCGYKSYIGGNLPNLRESASIEKIRMYHEEFYRPENLAIIICGQVNHAEVFEVLQPVEERILAKCPRGPFKRPWQDPVPPLRESVDLNVYYPCDDEDNGLVIAGWRGPLSDHEFYNFTGCIILLKYLADSSISPLQQEFVEIEDPYASDIEYDVDEYSAPLFCLKFDNVPKEKIHLIKERLMQVLKNIASKENSIDMSRMANVIHKYILEMLSNLEDDPHDSITNLLIGHFLFGNSDQDLNQRINRIDIIKELMEEPASYWLNVLNEYFVNSPVVVSKGIPSIEKNLKLAKKEKERIAKQIESLGEEGLKEKNRKLQEAITENEKPVPEELLKYVSIPSTDSIHFHNIKSFSTDSLMQHPKFDLKILPLYTYLDHVNTNFIYIFVVMDTLNVSQELRPYIPLFLESILACPLKRDGKFISYENVVTQLECDTVEASSGLGLNNSFRFDCGHFSNAANLMLKLELSKYKEGVRWIRDLLYQTEFSPERLKIIGTKIINDVAQIRRKGYTIAENLMNGLLFSERSNHYTANFLRQQKFLIKMIKRMTTDLGQKEIVVEINAVKQILTSKKSMALHIAVNVDKLVTYNPDVYEPWKKCFPSDEISSKSRRRIVPDHALIKRPEDIRLNGCVTGLGCTETAYLFHCIPCIKDYQHPDLAPLMVYLEYLTQPEGIMWKKIRGQGFSYEYNLNVVLNEGFLYLFLLEATNVLGAYKETRAIIESQLSTEKWDLNFFNPAKSSLIFQIINKESTVRSLVTRSLLSYYQNVSHDYNRQFIKAVLAVTLEDIKRVTVQYVEKLFEPKMCKTCVVCHPSKVSEIVDSFKEFGNDLKAYNSLEETFLNE